MSEDQKAIDSMADAMLGGMTPKPKEEPRKATYSSGTTSYYKPGSGNKFRERGSLNDLSPSAHTTSTRSTKPHEAFAPNKDRRQPVKDGKTLRDECRRLDAGDVNDLNMVKMMKRLEDALLDAFEEEKWILTGESGAFLFKRSIRDYFTAPLKQMAIKVATNDVMRDLSKPKK